MTKIIPLLLLALVISCSDRHDNLYLSDSETTPYCPVSNESVPQSWTSQLDTKEFGKVYDEGLLMATADLNAPAVGEFIKREMDVDVFQSELDIHLSCSVFQLDTVSGNVKQEWQRVTSGDTEEFKVQGLYLPINQPMGDLKTPLEKPIIIVNPEGNKWTLVHEMFHALFDKERMENDVYAVKLKENFANTCVKTEEKIDRYFGYGSNSEELRVIVDLLEECVKDTKALLNIYPVEEMVIESTLIDKYYYFHHMEDFRDNARRYISLSAEKAIKIVNIIINLTEKIDRKARYNRYDILKTRIRTLKNNQENYISKIKSLNSNYGSLDYHYVNGIQDFDHNKNNEGHVGCSKIKELDEVLDLLN